MALPTNRPRINLELQKLEDRTNPAGPFADGRVLVSLDTGMDPSATLAAITSSPDTTSIRSLGAGVYLVNLKPGVETGTAIADFSGKPGVKYVKRDGIHYPDALPNDTRFSEMWGLNNTGQGSGTPGADVGAVAGWDVGTGTGENLVAVLDSGFQYDHPDLAANIWHDPANLGSVGYDFGDNDPDPYTDIALANGTNEGGLGHGTHVMGTIGAVGNNNLGVTGVAWTTQMMCLKIGTGAGSGAFDSAMIEALNFAAGHGAKIASMSYGHDATALAPAILNFRAAGGIFVVAAGNESTNTDGDLATFQFTEDNVVVVAASDWKDQLSSFSNFGVKTVNIAAPGGDENRYGVTQAGILSTFPFPLNSYTFLQGTSMATPMASGTLVAFWDANPDLTYDEVLKTMYDTATPVPGLDGIISSGKRIDLDGMMQTTKGQAYFATGAGETGGSAVNFYRPSGKLSRTVNAFEPGFNGGVRVSTGDVTGDGETDVVVAAGPGGGPAVKVFDAKTGVQEYSFWAYEPIFNKGVNVAVGDYNGDGQADIIVGAEAGGGPRVSVFSLNHQSNQFERIVDFFAYAPNFTGGVRVSAGHFSSPTKMDIVVAPGLGGGPNIRVFHQDDLNARNFLPAVDLLAGNINDRGGLYVANGDFNGDGISDIVVGDGANTSGVRIYDGYDQHLVKSTTYSGGVVPGLVTDSGSGQIGAANDPQFPGDVIPPGTTQNDLVNTSSGKKPVEIAGYQYGVRVAVQEVNKNKQANLILGGGPTELPKVRIINGNTLAEIKNFYAYDSKFFGGIYVGAAGY